MHMENIAYLVLENGRVFQGKPFGAAVCEAFGETVFTTGMGGYLETLADKSYCGQIVVQTFPLIGNYGVIPADVEGRDTLLSAYVVKHFCREPSNFRSAGNLDAFLKERGIAGLYGVDTRSLTKLIRDEGVMNGKVTHDPESVDLGELKRHKITNAVMRAGVREPYRATPGGGKIKACVLDFGVNTSAISELAARGCDVTLLPPDSGFEAILAFSPDGIVLPNGPGDPADVPLAVRSIQALMKTGLPVFGFGLGHQLLALANGFRTAKLKYGHRGANQPVKDLKSNRVAITNQNHGYVVESESIDKNVAEELYVNVNDGTCEGIEYKAFPAFSVQFDAAAGDVFLSFEKFVAMMEERHAAR